jgi:hypothetical protein
MSTTSPMRGASTWASATLHSMMAAMGMELVAG